MKSLIFAVMIFLSGLAMGEIRLITEDSPPANYLVKGKLTGPAVDIVEAIKQKVGH